MFLGDDLLLWLLLALGAAMAVGNTMAIVRPPEERRGESDLEHAPIIRSLVYVVIGLVAAVAALASLIAG